MAFNRKTRVGILVMRILWLSHLVPYPPKGGVLQRSHHLLKQISKEFNVDLLAFHQPKLMRPIFSDVDKGLEISQTELSKFCSHIEVFSIPAGTSTFNMSILALKSLVTRAPYNINWLKSDSFASRMSKLLKDNKYDLIHFDTVSLYPFLKLAPPGVTTSLDHHNIESQMLLRRSQVETNLLKKLYFHQEGRRLKYYEKKFSEHVDINITCSAIDTDRLYKVAPAANVLTVPNGVDTGFFSPLNLIKNKPTEKKIVFIGRLNWYPNKQAVIYIVEKIWPLLKEKFPDVVCDIIGANPPTQAIQLSEVDPFFNVHGFMDDIHPYMSTSTIYLCPIFDGGGTKLKVLDALAMAMPIVAHPIACEGITVQENTNVLFARRPTEFVDQISKLFEDESLKLSIGKSGRRLIEQSYSFEAIGKNLTEAFIDRIDQTGRS